MNTPNHQTQHHNSMGKETKPSLKEQLQQLFGDESLDSSVGGSPTSRVSVARKRRQQIRYALFVAHIVLITLLIHFLS